METQTFQAITSAIAPIVMVSAAGLLYTGVQKGERSVPWKV